MEPNSQRKIIESLISQLEGNRFQDFCDRLGAELYPNDYHPVRAGGPHGDTKNDGYCPQARIFFAAHATRGETASKTRAKLTSDLEGCLKQHRDVRVWRYLTNETLRGEVDQYIDNELRPRYPEVTIEVWGHKRLADEIAKFDIPTMISKRYWTSPSVQPSEPTHQYACGLIHLNPRPQGFHCCAPANSCGTYSRIRMTTST